MTKDFSRQVLVSSYCSTARVNTCDAWQRLAFSHCTYEHVVCLELRQSVSSVWSLRLVCAENLLRDLPRRMGTNLLTARESCNAAFSGHPLEVPESARLVVSSFHQK